MVPEETTQVEFMAIEKVEPISKKDKLRAASAKLFPLSSTINLHYLKPLYVTANIEEYLISNIFIDYGATVNIMPIFVMKALHRSKDKLILSGVSMSSFVGDKSQTKRVMPLEVNIVGRNHMTAFYS